MNNILSRNKHGAVALLLKGSYRRIYTRLKELLSAEELHLFSIPERKNNEQLWHGQEGIVYQFVSLANEDEKDDVSIYLKKVKKNILAKLADDKELSGVVDSLFKIPDENEIHFAYDHKDQILVCLTQWACQSIGRDRNADPLSMIINRPVKDISQVNIIAQYSDGLLLNNKQLNFHYKDRINTIKTDEAGIVPIGLLKQGLRFSISVLGSPDNILESFIVTPERENYEVTMPYLTSFKVHVLDQDGQPVSGYDINAGYEGRHEEYRTDENGIVEISNFLLKKEPFSVFEKENTENYKLYDLDRETDNISFNVFVQPFSNTKINIIDEEGNIVPNHPIMIEIDGQDAHYISDKDGLIELGQLEAGKTLSVKDKKDTSSVKTYEVQKQSLTECYFEIKTPVADLVYIKLIDRKENVIPGALMNLSFQQGEHQGTTDDNGVIQFSKELLTDKEKVKVNIGIKKDNEKTKTYNRKFRFKKEQSEYIIKLKKRNSLWLLLLLIPLLLLLEFEKDITVKTLDGDSKQTISNLDVELSYQKHALFSGGFFFNTIPVVRKGTTDSTGLVRFENLSYTLYSAIFKRGTKAKFVASNDCYALKNEHYRFHKLKESKVVELFLGPLKLPLDFLVVDKEDKEPLTGAEVSATFNFYGKKYSDSLKTQADGRVVFTNAPRCGDFEIVIANLYGYYPDTILTKSVEDLTSGSIEETRLLELEAIKKQLTFFVINCINEEPIPNATATVSLSDSNGVKVSKNKTNVNGKGKHEYDDAHIIRKVKIEVQKPYFKPGLWDKGLTVEEFLNLPDSLRTICLEPEKRSLTLKDIDEFSKKGLPGVKNVVEVKRNGKLIRTDHIFSNANGSFTIGDLKAGDRITINASLDPNYEPNNVTIVNKELTELLSNKNNRIIPLRPKEVTLTFRTMDGDLKNSIANVDLKVFVDGKIDNAVKNSGGGNFTVKGYYSSIISIVAEKTGYQTNNTKIKNKAFSYLAPSNQNHRDIPMIFPPCATEPMKSKKTEEHIQQFDMGQISGGFLFTYKLYSVANDIIVYDGPIDDIQNSGILFKELNSKKSDDKRLKFSKRFVTVVVRGSSDWDYEVNCPF